jgi:hypothetical protein
MNGETTTLGAVSVQYDDYVGTAAADTSDALAPTRSLYQMIGLDRDQWMILSIELASWKGSSLTGARLSERVSVYAIDRDKYGIRSMADVEELVESGAGLPVVAFDLPDTVDLGEFMAEAFQRISVRLVSQAVQGQPLDVTARHKLG